MSLRTDYCGELSAADAGREVAVCGWVHARREHGEHLAFIENFQALFVQALLESKLIFFGFDCRRWRSDSASN